MTCPSGKRTWKKRGGAHREAKRLTRMHRNERRTHGPRRGLEVLEYRCPDCGFWHVMTDGDSSRAAIKQLREKGMAS